MRCVLIEYQRVPGLSRGVTAVRRGEYIVTIVVAAGQARQLAHLAMRARDGVQRRQVGADSVERQPDLTHIALPI